VSSHPTVSICIPTWNRERLVVDALDSALGQVGDVDFEVLVVDNASTDATVDVARQFARRDARVRVVCNPENIGCYPNYARCLEEATGDYIKFLNSDDVLHPDALARMVPLLGDPGISLVTAGTRLVDLGGTELPLEWWAAPPVETDARIPGPALADLCLVRSVNHVGSATSTLFRRADVQPDQVGWFGGHWFGHAGDVATWMHLLGRGDTAFLAAPVADTRMHPGAGGLEPDNVVVRRLDWFYLVTGGAAAGFLRDPRLHRAALVNTVRSLADAPELVDATPWTAQVTHALVIGSRELSRVHGTGTPGRRTYVTTPDWDDEPALRSVLDAWIDAFPGDSEVELVVPCDIRKLDVGAAHARLTSLLDRMGRDPATIPDVVVQAVAGPLPLGDKQVTAWFAAGTGAAQLAGAGS